MTFHDQLNNRRRAIRGTVALKLLPDFDRDWSLAMGIFADAIHAEKKIAAAAKADAAAKVAAANAERDAALAKLADVQADDDHNKAKADLYDAAVKDNRIADDADLAAVKESDNVPTDTPATPPTPPAPPVDTLTSGTGTDTVAPGGGETGTPLSFNPQ